MPGWNEVKDKDKDKDLFIGPQELVVGLAKTRARTGKALMLPNEE